jgi:PPM family protein phosphatase
MLECENPRSVEVCLLFDTGLKSACCSLRLKNGSKRIGVRGSYSNYRYRKVLAMSAISTPEAIALQIAGQCDRGKVRDENQDSVRHCVTPLGDLLMVADGMGGYEGGAVASRMAVEAIAAGLESMPAFFPIDIAIEEAVCRANAEILAAAAEPETPNHHMGSTVVLALLRQDPENAQAIQAWIGHVGDSRAYLLHDHRLTRVTRDHSAVQMLIDQDLIAPAEAETHPDASVLTRTLGREPNLKVDMNSVELGPGDTLLLCSDGLWGFVSDQEIERILADPRFTAEQASHALLDLALDAGGHDNVGIQVARVAGSVAAAALSQPAPAYESPSVPELPLPYLLAPQPLEPSAAPAAEPEIVPFAQAEAAPAAAPAVPIFHQAPAPEIPPPFAPAPPPVLEAEPETAPRAGAGIELEPALRLESTRELPLPEKEIPYYRAPETQIEPRIPDEQVLGEWMLDSQLWEGEPAPVAARGSESVSDQPEPRLDMLLGTLATLWETFRYPLGRDYDFAPEWHTDFTSLSECFEEPQIEARPQLPIVPVLLARVLVTCAAVPKRGFDCLPRQDPDLPAQFRSSSSEVSTLLMYLGILLMAFCTSCGFVYCALFLNWFGIDQLLHLR